MDDYLCSFCGAPAFYDGRCGDGPVLLCDCGKGRLVNEGPRGQYYEPTGAEPIMMSRSMPPPRMPGRSTTDKTWREYYKIVAKEREKEHRKRLREDMRAIKIGMEKLASDLERVMKELGLDGEPRQTGKARRKKAKKRSTSGQHRFSPDGFPLSKSLARAAKKMIDENKQLSESANEYLGLSKERKRRG